MIRIALFICSILAVFFVIFQWILPGFSKIEEEKLLLNEAKNTLNTLEERIATFEKITTFFEGNTQMTSLASAYLPESGYEDRILNALSLAGQNSGLYIQKLVSTGTEQSTLQAQIPYTAETDADGAPTTPNQLRMKNLEVTFTGIGTYENMKQFLSNLSSLERGFKSSLISIQKAEILEEFADTSDDTLASLSKKDDVLQMNVTLSFLYATKSLAKGEDILASFDPASRSLTSLETMSKRETVFPIGGLNDLPYTLEGKANPFLFSSAE